jgi:hypothetical protein
VCRSGQRSRSLAGAIFTREACLDAPTAFSRSRLTAFDRIIVVVLLAVFTLGYPGLGIETRVASNTAALSVAYSLAFLGPLLALGTSWRWPRIAAWSALAGGSVAVALVLLDLAGILGGPPPVGMVIVDAIVAVLGALLVWRSWRLVRS